MFTDLISKKFSDAFDLDVELRDIADNSDEFPTLRALALLSIGMPLHDGYMSCRELLEILHWCADGRPEGKERLAKLLGTDCDDYQRALYYTLAGRGGYEMLGDLKRLTDVMASRCKIAVACKGSGFDQKEPFNPYVTARADGPLGKFNYDFLEAEFWNVS